MVRIAMKVEECCEWCRQPIDRCRDLACDDARTYSGVLLRGEWQRIELAERQVSEPLQARAA
jgi:hypothetical protein